MGTAPPCQATPSGARQGRELASVVPGRQSVSTGAAWPPVPHSHSSCCCPHPFHRTLDSPTTLAMTLRHPPTLPGAADTKPSLARQETRCAYCLLAPAPEGQQPPCCMTSDPPFLSLTSQQCPWAQSQDATDGDKHLRGSCPTGSRVGCRLPCWAGTHNTGPVPP